MINIFGILVLNFLLLISAMTTVQFPIIPTQAKTLCIILISVIGFASASTDE